jgi:hypothetical protein
MQILIIFGPEDRLFRRCDIIQWHKVRKRGMTDSIPKSIS